MRLAGIVLGLLAAACGGAPSAHRAAPAPEAASHIRYAPQTVRYHAAHHRHVVQELSGSPRTSDIVSQLWISSTITQSDSGLHATLVLDSLHISSSTVPTPPNLAAVNGATFSGTLEPTGVLSGFTAPDSASPLVTQLSSGFRTFYPRIPAEGAAEGTAWSDSTSTPLDANGVTGTIASANTHRATGWVQYAGQRALAVETVAHYTLKGTGSPGGQDLSLDGTGTRRSTQYLSVAGIYLGAIGTDSLSYSVELMQSGVTIPSTQQSTDTLEMIP